MRVCACACVCVCARVCVYVCVCRLSQTYHGVTHHPAVTSMTSMTPVTPVVHGRVVHAV